MTRDFSLPTRFVELKDARSDLVISERVLQPVVTLRRDGEAIVAGLAGRRHVKGKEILNPAAGLEYDWVLEGHTAYPLPIDIGEQLSALFAGTTPSRLTFPQALELAKCSGNPIEVRMDESILTSANDRAATLPTKRIPGLNAKLYPYQATGTSWLLDTLGFCNGAILADEMGLGKTLQIIAALLSLELQPRSPALIVCPATLLANWSRELHTFAPSLSLAVHTGPRRAAIYRELMTTQIVITTYDTLVSDISLFRSVDWSIVVCDEAQAIKNPASQRRKALVQLSRVYTVPVTGTPVENSLLDLWSLADFAVPGVLGDEADFSREFPDSEDGANRLAAITNPLVLKRRVEDVAQDLPERFTIDLPISLENDLAQGYERLREHVLANYGRAGALVATGQLALFCAHPWLTSASVGEGDWEDAVDIIERPDVPIETPKLDVTARLLKEAFLRSRKVLIFANFNRCGEIIRRVTKDLPTGYWNSINGSTPQDMRQAIVDEFSAFEGPAVLILNPRAAGTGLNITAATVVIHYTQVWNPAVEAQASARAHRRGQTLPVTIYRLYYEGTVEEIMLERTLWKSELANSAVPISTRDAGDFNAALNISPRITNDRSIR